MSAENGKLLASTKPLPKMLPTTKIKRETASMLLTNGNGAFAKLSSLTPARDLTLGGRGPLSAAGKKVFTPNLNVVRNKNTNVKTSKDTTPFGRSRGYLERGRGSISGRGSRAISDGNNALIQTTGVFSEGAGAVNTRKSTGGHSSFSRSADDAPSAMRKPMVAKSDHQKVDVKAEAARVLELLGASDEDDFIDEKTDLEKIPIKLNEAKWKYVKLENPEIKLEKPDENTDSTTKSADNTIELVQQIQQMQTKQRLSGISRYPVSIDELLDSKQSQIFVMQLPDTLPCVEGVSDSREKSSSSLEAKEQLSDSTLTTPATKTSCNSLKNMEEGQVGKLLRYKSGKIKLVLGESYFDVNMGMETGFLQELMSINTNHEERSGNMINLGSIQAKLTATPDWEFMLRQQP